MRRHPNIFLGLVVLISWLILPWYFGFLLLAAGIFFFEGFVAAPWLALLADALYGAAPAGRFGFQFWLTGGTVILLLAAWGLRRIIIIRS